MSFDPRLIHPDEPPEDFDAVLAELGAQLRDDAKMLAAKYPAKPVRATPVTSPWRRWSVRAAGVAAVMVTAGMLLPFGRMRPLPPPVVTDAAPAAHEVVPVSSNVAVSDPMDGFSGPELEGVLDLLETQDDGRASLSL